MNKTKNKSFTLLEVLVVVIIIGVMAAIIIVNTNDALEKKQRFEVLSFAEGLKSKNVNSLVSEWTFDGPTPAGSAATNADVKDSWGYNDGDVVGHAPTVKEGDDCVSGKCLEFNGSTYVEVLNNANLNFGEEEFTISMWAKMNVHADSAALFTKSGSCSAWGSPGYAFTTISSPDDVYFMWAGTCCGHYTNLENPDGTGFEWRHVVGIRREITSGTCLSYAEFYMDGNYMGRTINGTCTQSISNSSNVYIGKKSGCAGGLTGLIDEVTIYGRALTFAEVKEKYVAGLNSLLQNGAISKEEYNQRTLNLAQND